MRRELVGPHQRTVARPAGEDAVGPLVLAGPLLGIIGAGIPGAEIDQVELRVVGDPTPHRPAAAAPRVAFPRRHADVRIAGIVSPAGAREHQRVGAHVVRRPKDLARGEVEALHPAVDPELAARRSYDHPFAGDERRHRCRLALAQVRDLRLPQLTPRDGIDRDGVPVEQVVDDLAVRVHCAAVDRVTARDAE